MEKMQNAYFRFSCFILFLLSIVKEYTNCFVLNSEQEVTEYLHQVFEDEIRSETLRLKQLLNSQSFPQSERNGDEYLTSLYILSRCTRVSH